MVILIDFGYYDKECIINNFDKKYIVNSIDLNIYFRKDLNDDLIKAIHKNKFYKDLHDELMVIAWHPSRYLDWCIDVEELKFLKGVWGEED